MDGEGVPRHAPRPKKPLGAAAFSLAGQALAAQPQDLFGGQQEQLRKGGGYSCVGDLGLPQQGGDEAGDLASLIGRPRLDSFHGHAPSMSCENSLSELTPTIAPVSLIDTPDSLLFDKEGVFEAAASVGGGGGIKESNRLLTKLIQNYRSEASARHHEYAKLPPARRPPSAALHTGLCVLPFEGEASSSSSSSSHPHDPILAKLPPAAPLKRSSSKDGRFAFHDEGSRPSLGAPEPLLIGGESLLTEGDFTPILSQLPHPLKEPRPVDIFLSELHVEADDAGLLHASLASSIVPDIGGGSGLAPSSGGSSSSGGGGGGGAPSHLPELPPSPIMASLLGGGGAKASSPGGGPPPPFLGALSSASEEHLALSLTNFLENSNMSIGMESFSEGDASLHHPFGGSDLDAPRRAAGAGAGGSPELTFTHALKNNAAEKDRKAGLERGPSPFAGAAVGSPPRKDAAPVPNLSPGDIFKVPPQQQQQIKAPPPSSTDESSSSSTSSVGSSSSSSPPGSVLGSNRRYSAREIPLIKIDGEAPQPQPRGAAPRWGEALLEQVSCFKCPLCSFLHVEKAEVLDHVKKRHDGALPFDAASPEMPPPAPTPPPPTEGPSGHARRRKRPGPDAPKRRKRSRAPPEQLSPAECKVEICPREKGGGFQRRVVMVAPDEGAPKTPSVKAECDSEGLLDVKNDIIIDDVPLPQQQERRPPAASGPAKTQARPGRPAASQTMGIIKFCKNYPKVSIPEETLGIRCGVNGCGLRLRQEENIAYHRRCHVEAFLRCPECQVKFTHWASLAMHLWRIHMIDMELHKCEKCNFKAYSYTKLMNGHWKTHSTERPFLCDVCGKDFKTAKQLKSHKILHIEKDEDLKHHCDMCKRKFAEKRMLLLHLEAVHKKVKPYLCNYCGKNFASKSTLNLHIRKHTGEKPFACEFCNYRTSDHNSMRRHKMKHTNDRPYACPYCDYSSIQSSTYKVHLRRKHELQAQKDGVIFSCSFCTFKTVKRDNFLAHAGTHHKITEEEQNRKAERLQQQITQEASKKQQQQRGRDAASSGKRWPAQPPKEEAAAANGTAAAILVASPAPSKAEEAAPAQSQQPMLCVFVPSVPHVVNIDVNETEAAETSADLVNGVLLPGTLPSSLSGPMIMAAEGTILQPTTINDGVVQLTPEVVAMPVTTDLTTSLLSNRIIYVTTSGEGEGTNCRLVQNSPLFS